MTAIKENTDFARKLGLLPISQRKFDRHVPRMAAVDARREESFSTSHEDDSDSDKENHEERELIDGEEVHLIKNDIEIFKAKFQETEPLKSTVHGKFLL